MSNLYYIEARKQYRGEISRNIDVDGVSVRIRKTKLYPKGTSKQEAEAMIQKWETDLVVKANLVTASTDWVSYVENLYNDKQSWIHQSVNRMKYRSKNKVYGSHITAKDVKELLLLTKGKCAITGVDFQTRLGTGKNPYYHSIDRIDSSQGYKKENCRIVCYAVNVAMMAWGDEIFSQLAIGYVINKYCSFNLAKASTI